MIKAFQQIDLTYINRLNRLDRIYKDGEKILQECQDTWDYLLETEKVSIPKLNVLHDKMESVKEIMTTIKQEMNRIKLELSN
jgi:hypothetical protein